MKSFVRPLIIFLIPVFIFIAIPVFVLVQSKELLSYKELTSMHNADAHSLIGTAYSNPAKYMKLHAVVAKKPSILVLGTSRVMQVRNFFFNNPKDVYNAGGGISQLKEYKYFLTHLPSGYKPELVMLSLDQYFFNSNWDNLKKNAFDPEYNEKYDLLSYVFSNTLPIWKDVLLRKISLINLSKSHRAGLNAQLHNNGFRADGSYYYGSFIDDSTSNPDLHFKDTYERMRRGNNRFEYGTTINPAAVQELKSLLAFTSEQNIHVIAILPSYSQGVLQKMKEMSPHYDYIFELQRQLPAICDRYNTPLFDFTNPAIFGATDAEMIDGFHISEKACLKMFLHMAARDSVLNRQCDTQKLQTLLQSSPANLELSF